MKETKIRSLDARKKLKRKKKRRLVRNIVAYLKSDGYLFVTEINTPLPSSKAEDISMGGFEKVIKKKRRMWEKVKEYLKSDCYMYGSMISRLRIFKPWRIRSTSLRTTK